jgi:Na+/proline symporter
MVLTLAVQGTDQFFVQRLLAARSRRAAAWGVFASGLVVFAQFALFLLIGVMLWVFYQQHPLPVPVDRADKIVSVYVLHSLGAGLAGVIIAAIVAAALSPSINALAATTVNDFYRPYVRPDADDAHLMRVSRIATVGWGLVQLAIAIGAQFMQQGVLDAGLTVLGLSSGAVLGAFLLGTLWPSVPGPAVFVGMVAGISVVVVLWWASPIAWTWHALIGATTTAGVALIAAAFLPARSAPAPA